MVWIGSITDINHGLRMVSGYEYLRNDSFMLPNVVAQKEKADEMRNSFHANYLTGKTCPGYKTT